ncbi:MAG: DUF5615 family PIN-like protein [Gaiellaceae bacterium]
MRVLLDAQLSHRFLTDPLRRNGHDVLSLQEERALDGLADEDVLALAAAEERVLVTRNSRDFAPLTRTWAEAGREHAGCVLIWSFEHHEYGPILQAVERLLAEIDDQAGWKSLVLSV